MKVLFVIPHYYKGVAEKTRYASHSIAMRANRLQVLDTLIFKLHLLFGRSHYGAVHDMMIMEEMPNPFALDVDVMVCTTGDDHLVGDLSCEKIYFEHVPVECEPLVLGFAAHRIMRDHLGRYDYYCYLEDDILIHDQFFFKKLEIFNANSPLEHLLQPQRFESCMFNGKLKNGFLTKVYPDYRTVTPPVDAANYTLDVLGVPITLERTTHPHAGSFFLNAEQFAHLAQNEDFVSPEGVSRAMILDAAASMSISRHFTIFKPARSCMSFFEVEHGHSNMIDQISLGDRGVRWFYKRSVEGTLATALKNQQAGRLEWAAELYRSVLHDEPENLDALNLYGVLLRQMGDLANAEQIFSFAIRLDDRLGELHRNLGLTLMTTSPERAEACFQRAVALDPGDRESLEQLGGLLEERGAYGEAATCLEKAAELAADNGELWYNLGSVHVKNNDQGKALQTFRRAIACKPGLAEAHVAEGIMLQSGGAYEDAVNSYRRALSVSPQLVQAHYNLGTALKELRRIDEAIAVYRQCLSLNPDHGDAHWNLALLLLMTGDLTHGWQQFHWRHRRSKAGVPRQFPVPAWDGSPLQGRTILLYGEQGAGDTLQFIRYVTLVAGRGGTIVVECQHAGLKRLLQGIPQVSAVFVQGETLPPFHCHASLLDLPALFATTLATVPATVPYLAPDPTLVAAWRQRLDSPAALKVGLVWAGNRRHENDGNRSMSAEKFQLPNGLPDVAYYSLQVGDGPLAMPLAMDSIDVTGQIVDFADTAAIIANLDLVITVDTAVAHLAGALGKPVWVLLPFVPDWRWLLDRDDSPWYPTMHLFRQQHAGDWEGVLARVGDALTGNRLEEGLQLYRQGALEKAADYFRRILAACPGCAPAARRLAYICQDLGHLDEAVEEYQRALRLGGDADVWNDLGTAYRQLDRLGEAMKAFGHATALVPGHLLATINLGAALQADNRPQEAVTLYRDLLISSPTSTEAKINLGTALQDAGKLEEAEAVYRQLLQEQPENAEAHWNLALALLAQGQLKEGWHEYEWRWLKREDPTPKRQFPQPEWDGTPLGGRTVLLWAEQGLGDTLQFIRYAALVERIQGQVIMECQHPGLKPVLETVPGVRRVFVRGEALPHYDCQVPLLSLPLFCRTELATIPAQVPYIFTLPEREALWRERVGTSNGLKVGLVWGGNRSLPNYRRRSLPPSLLAPLAQVPGVSWFSLQMDTSDQERASLPPELMLTDLTASIGDFADTAALIASLDLTITVDTSVAHLAGAMGRPVWTLLTFAADWRWLDSLSDSPWYPTMRIFRQQAPGEWASLLDRVATELALLSSNVR